MCGNASHSRKMIYRIGMILLEEHPHILVPVCPDYSHQDGTFTFTGIGSDVPVLLRLHTKFLRRVQAIIPNLRVTFLVADQEASVPELAAVLGVTQDEFRARVSRSIEVSVQFLQTERWSVVPMTRFIPGFVELKAAQVEALIADASLHAYLIGLTNARAGFYRKIGYAEDVWFQRTVQTAAEYLVLGAYANTLRAIVCNHTSANLSWYARIRTAVLHDPVRVY